MKYSDYLKKSGMTNKDIVAALQPHFPKFSKIQCSMLTHPESYGLQLSPKAQALLPPLSSKLRPGRAKPNRLVVYLDDEQYRRVLAAKGEASTQQYLEVLIKKDAVG